MGRYESVAACVVALSCPIVGAAQVPLPNSASAETEVEVQEVTAFRLGLYGGLGILADDELFEYAGSGSFAGIEGVAEFDRQFNVRLRVLAGRHSDDLSSTPARTADILFAVSRFWRSETWLAGAGPQVGYLWIDREVYSETTGGFTAGGTAWVERRLNQALSIGLEVHTGWTVVATPSFTDGTKDPDGRAVGRRAGLGLRMSFLWPDT